MHETTQQQVREAPAPVTRTAVALIGAAWLAGAVGVSSTGWLERLPRPAVQGILVALTAGLLVLGSAVPRVRAWALSLDPRAVLALHLTRFVGAYFLVLYAAGRLPYAFAVPGGVGDILVATTAAVLILAVDPRGPVGQRTYLTWNVFGLIDILMVVATAARLGLADPASMRELARLPLSLLPTFLVPLIIASHVLLFVRLRAGGSDGVVE